MPRITGTFRLGLWLLVRSRARARVYDLWPGLMLGPGLTFTLTVLGLGLRFAIDVNGIRVRVQVQVCH